MTSEKRKASAKRKACDKGKAYLQHLHKKSYNTGGQRQDKARAKKESLGKRQGVLTVTKARVLTVSKEGKGREFEAGYFVRPGGKTTREASSCLLYTSPSPRDGLLSRMPSSA